MRETEGRDNQQVTDIEVGWLAGLIDGEGSFDLQSGHQWTPRIMITNTDQRIIDRAVEIIQRLGVGVYVWTQTKHNPRHKPIKRLAVRGIKRVHAFLPKIAPALIGKRDQAEKLLNFTTERLSRPYHTNADDLGHRVQAELAVLRKGTSETTRIAPSAKKDEDIVHPAS